MTKSTELWKNKFLRKKNFFSNFYGCLQRVYKCLFVFLHWKLWLNSWFWKVWCFQCESSSANKKCWIRYFEIRIFIRIYFVFFFFCKFVKREFVVCKKFNLFKWEKSRKVDNYNLLAEYTTMIHYRCYGDRCNTWSEKELIT